ncbi:hypothetical protein [Rhodoligotrophos defluvii]|uniref:hypothetical protein n=1 Tax=Rhodoligotrophos defluvii TaxID=2561934 RepID=UPI0010C9D4B6|nr:hypothetical protein [Rhodoligotrophos defluvii]
MPFVTWPVVIEKEATNKFIVRPNVSKLEISGETFYRIPQDDLLTYKNPIEQKINIASSINEFKDINGRIFVEKSVTDLTKDFWKGVAHGVGVGFTPLVGLGVAGGVALDRWLLDPHHTSDDTSHKDDFWPH